MHNILGIIKPLNMTNHVITYANRISMMKGPTKIILFWMYNK